jgi:hypothetical protein
LNTSPESQPSARQLVRAVVIALVVAVTLLATVILPAEFGIDPLGTGRVLGLSGLGGAEQGAAATTDVGGGNAKVDPNAVVAAGEPLPLPNPAVHQSATSDPRSETVTVSLPPGRETEVKVVMKADQTVLYTWHTDKGAVYFDFHGHSPEWTNREAFVRYQEVKDGLPGARGSLVAPFAGEHGWYWANLTNEPMVITLKLTGYFEGIKDYGVH